MKRTVIVLSVMLIIGMQAEAQKKKPSPTKKTFTTSPIPPAFPTEIGINYHRMKDKVLYLTIKNTGAKPIKKVSCSVLVIDIVTMKQVASFGSATFEYAVDVSPKESFMAILDENKLPKLRGDNIALGKCFDYKYAQETFIPNRCTQDAFTISISSIIFSDGTEWVQPKVAEILERSSRPSPKNPTPYEQPSFKLSQLKQRKITKQEFGELWAFVPSDGVLACNSTEEERLFFIDGAKAYALNGWAIDSKIDGVKVSPNLKEVIGNDNGIQFFMKMASSLCR
jgi:hypothetical protein